MKRKVSETIKLTGNYGYTGYKFSEKGLDVDVLDASAASWTLANQGSQLNLYPFQVTFADPGLIVRGGTINGQVSQTADWEDAYINAAGLRVQDAPGVIIENWRIDRPWDGIRVAGKSTGFQIRDVWITNSRDDAIEDDDAIGGTISDSLFDGVFSGISLGDGDVDGHTNVVTLDHVLLRNKSFLYKDEITHVSPLKLDKGTGSDDVTPSLKITNTIFAIEDVDHGGQERLQKAWSKTIESSGNTFLNLSDTPLPNDYPMPGKGWTILQGQAARDFWAAARKDWIERHDGGVSPDPIPDPKPDPKPDPIPDPTPDPTPGLKQIVGTKSGDVLNGTSGADQIDGLAGVDRINGKGGSDVLTGGSSDDYFVFDTKLGSGNVDRITDFTPEKDHIQLDNAIFDELGSARGLKSDYFRSGTAARDGDEHIIYNPKTGTLAYDDDGSGAHAAVVFAQLAAGLKVDHGDIIVI